MKRVESIAALWLALVALLPAALLTGCGGGGTEATTTPGSVAGSPDRGAPPAVPERAGQARSGSSHPGGDGAGKDGGGGSPAGSPDAKRPKVVVEGMSPEAAARVVKGLLGKVRRETPDRPHAHGRGVLESIVPGGAAAGKGPAGPDSGSDGASGDGKPASPAAAVKEILEQVRAGQ